MKRKKFSYVTICVIILALMLALPGCLFTKLMTTRFENPTFSFRGFELVEASQNRAIVNFLFTAHNPNHAGLKNVTCSYDLFVEGRKFLTGNDIPLTLNPKGDTEITVPATIVYTDLFPALQSVVLLLLSRQKSIPIEIEAVFSGKPAIYGKAGKEESVFFDVKLNKTVDVPLPR